MDTLEILERLKIVTNSNNYAELARKLNIKDSTIRTWKTRSTIPYEACAIVTLSYDTTLEWLLMGDDATATTKNRVNETAAIYNNITLPFYELETDNGQLDSNNNDTIDLLVKSNKQGRLITFNLPYLKKELGVNPEQVFLMHARGDSMSPTINDGAVIMVEQNSELSGDGIYVIQQGSALLIKRLQHLMTGEINVLADNTKYDAYTVDKSTFEADGIAVLGRVVWAGQKV